MSVCPDTCCACGAVNRPGLRYCRACGHDSYHPCPICGGITSCPMRAGLVATAADAGLPEDWRPVLARTRGDRGPRRLDEAATRASLPENLDWITVGSRSADRLRTHGIQSFWVSQCTYIALVRAATPDRAESGQAEG